MKSKDFNKQLTMHFFDLLQICSKYIIFHLYLMGKYKAKGQEKKISILLGKEIPLGPKNWHIQNVFHLTAIYIFRGKNTIIWHRNLYQWCHNQSQQVTSSDKAFRKSRYNEGNVFIKWLIRDTVQDGLNIETPLNKRKLQHIQPFGLKLTD